VLADGSINVGSETLMSRGPGKIQRAVIAVFEAEPEKMGFCSQNCASASIAASTELRRSTA
jgi:hypothetical protein